MSRKNHHFFRTLVFLWIVIFIGIVAFTIWKLTFFEALLSATILAVSFAIEFFLDIKQVFLKLSHIKGWLVVLVSIVCALPCMLLGGWLMIHRGLWGIIAMLVPILGAATAANIRAARIHTA